MDHHANSGNNDLTRAAQARRRQRVAMNATTPPAHSLPPQQVTTNTVNVMNESMEVGSNAAFLLASIRKERKIPSTSASDVATAATDETESPTSYFMSMLVNKPKEKISTVSSTTKNNSIVNSSSIDNSNGTTSTSTGLPRTSTSTTGSANTDSSTRTRRTKNQMKPPPPTQHQQVTLTMAPLSISLSTAKAPSIATTTEGNDDPDENSYNDDTSLCLTDGSLIRIQSHAYPTRTISASPLSHSDFVGATLKGNFLQEAWEVLQIRIQQSTSAPSNHRSNSNDQFLYFGDTVRLQCVNTIQSASTTSTSGGGSSDVSTSNAKSRPPPLVLTCALNQANQHHNNHTIEHDGTYTMQFLPWKSPQNNSSRQQQLWKILSSSSYRSTGSSTEIKIGRAALEEDALQRLSNHPTTKAIHVNNSNSNDDDNRLYQLSQQVVKRIPIRYSDSIVLRNCASGGILSCGRPTTGTAATIGLNLWVLTDATFQPHIDMTNYDGHDDDDDDDETSSNRINSSTNARTILPRHQTSAMSQLQHSNHFIPSSYEEFSFVHPSLPIIPLWMKDRCQYRSNDVQAFQFQSRSPNSTTTCYMDMSYLFYPDRHQIMDDMAHALLTTSGELMDRTKNIQNRYDNDDALYEQSRTVRGQEKILLYEFINACMGMEGRYIRAVISNPSTNDKIINKSNPHLAAFTEAMQFHLFDDVRFRWDVIVRRLIEDVLLLPTLFARVQYFFHQRSPGYEYGHVMQAFCNRLRDMMHEHVGTVVLWHQQYINGFLTLTKFQKQLHSSINTLSILHQICQVAKSQRGGALINSVRRWQWTFLDGDTASEQIVTSLLEAASVPYMTRFIDWLEMGLLADDPHGEFMIEISDNSNSSWGNKYVLSKRNMLEGFFATEQLVKQVLATGRYWSAIQSCDLFRSQMIIEETRGTSTLAGIQYTSNISSISAFIQTKHSDASWALLQLLTNDYDLLNVLRVTKQYFLLEHGDFFVNFLDCAEEELLKDVTLISPTRIQHWIDSSRQDQSDFYTKGAAAIIDGLKCRLSTLGLADCLDKLRAVTGGIDTNDSYDGTFDNNKSELTGLDAFYLDLANVPFPISTVLSSTNIASYQLLFRHLFYVKYVERRMVSVWTDHQMMKELKSLRSPMGTTYLLRQRMLHLLQNLIYYMMYEVIEPNWLTMEKAICAPTSRSEQTVDDILRHHAHFLQHTMEACLLTNHKVVHAVSKLLKTCLLFSEQMKRFMKATKLEEERNLVATDKQKDVRQDFYSRLTKRSYTKSSTKHLQENFRRSRNDRSNRVQQQTARIDREVCREPYRQMISRFEAVFNKNLKDFLIQINDSDDIFRTHKLNLGIRLEYNGYKPNSLG